MALAPVDLLTPKGRLDADVLWPDVTKRAVDAKLTAWLAEGETEAAALAAGTAHDKAVKSWAYYRAYGEVYESMVALPSSASDADEGSASYTQGQIELMRELRDQSLAVFTALVTVPADLTPLTRESYSAPNVFTR